MSIQSCHQSYLGPLSVHPSQLPPSEITATWPLWLMVSHTVTKANSPPPVTEMAVGTLPTASLTLARFCAVNVPTVKIVAGFVGLPCVAISDRRVEGLSAAFSPRSSTMGRSAGSFGDSTPAA